MYYYFFIQLIFICRCQRRKHWMQEKLALSTMSKKRKHVEAKRFAPQADNTILLQQLNQDKGYGWNAPSHISGKRKTGWEFLTKHSGKKRNNQKHRQKKQQLPRSLTTSGNRRRVIQTPEDLLHVIGVQVKPHLLHCIHRALRQPVHELSHRHRNHVSQLAGPAVQVVLQAFAGQHWFVGPTCDFICLFIFTCDCIRVCILFQAITVVLHKQQRAPARP